MQRQKINKNEKFFKAICLLIFIITYFGYLFFFKFKKKITIEYLQN